MRVGINGMGRIGRLALRAAMGGFRRPDGDPRGENRLDVVHINELKGGIAATAHLLEFDSIHGRWHQGLGVYDDQTLAIGHHRIGFTAAAMPADIPWGDIGCEIVLECTGKCLTPNALEAYFDRGVKRVIVAAPVGVCNRPGLADALGAPGCCGGPAKSDASACCAADEAVKAAGKSGCGCGPVEPQGAKTSSCCG